MKCKFCGEELIEGTNFCLKCGKNNVKEEILSNENQKNIKPINQKNNKPFVWGISIFTAFILIAIITLIVLCLPPSKRRIESDALNYANVDSAYTVSDIVVSKTNQSDGFLADVQIEAINNDNNDINHIQLNINYSRNGLSYDKNLSGSLESSILPNHKPSENDLFPLPDILLETNDSNESSRCSADTEGISTEIDYEHIVINKNTAEVPLTVRADYVNAKGESTVTVQYIYERDYVWSGENVVNVDLKPKNNITDELISEDIKNNTFVYNGYISEELDGTYMKPTDSSIQYTDFCTHALVKTVFRWQNENVNLTGDLLLSYDYINNHWVFSDGQVDRDSVTAEWLYDFDETLVAEQLPEIIINNCTENNGISNIEIVNKIIQGEKTVITVNYTSVHQAFIFKNVVELDYNATVFQGYQLGDIREISSDYWSINCGFDKDISVNYSTNTSGTTPNGMSQKGTATVHMHINEGGEVHLTGMIGTIPLDNYGSIEYPTGALYLNTCQKDINVNYLMIFNNDADIPYKITPSLSYYDGKFRGTIYCKSLSLGVKDFSVDIQ